MNRRLFLPVVIMFLAVLLLGGLINYQAGQAEESPEDVGPIVEDPVTVSQGNNVPVAEKKTVVQEESTEEEAPTPAPTFMGMGGGGISAPKVSSTDEKIVTSSVAVPGTATDEDTSVSVTPSSTSLSPMVTETGLISISVDGLGTDGTGIIQVEKPAGATVRSAYFMGASLWGSSQIADGQILIDGQGVNWDYFVHKYTYNHWADVTDLVKTKIDAAPAGRIDFEITETGNAYNVDGTVLVVIFDDPNQTTDNTIVLLFGAQDVNGDTFNLLLAEPVDKSDASMAFDMGLGISYSYQSGSGQYSIVEVNTERVTTAAGGEDDGYSSNGGLLTVGGLDDSNANPVDPNQTAYSDPRLDDELYNILPFVENGDDTITVFTQNPSNDDNIFFAYFNLKSTVAVVGEGIVLGPASASNPVGTLHTVTATVQDNDGYPVVGRTVSIDVISGPHAGTSGSGVTDSNGQFQLSYTGTIVGTDTIEASCLDSQGAPMTSNQATKTWVDDDQEIPDGNQEIPEFPTIAIPMVAIIGMAFIFSRKQ